MGKIPGNKIAAIFCFAGVIFIYLSQAMKSFAVVFWTAALITFVIALGFAGSAYVQRKQQRHSPEKK